VAWLILEPPDARERLPNAGALTSAQVIHRAILRTIYCVHKSNLCLPGYFYTYCSAVSAIPDTVMYALVRVGHHSFSAARRAERQACLSFAHEASPPTFEIIVPCRPSPPKKGRHVSCASIKWRPAKESTCTSPMQCSGAFRTFRCSTDAMGIAEDAKDGLRVGRKHLVPGEVWVPCAKNLGISNKVARDHCT